MKNIYLILGLLLIVTACDNDLDQFPPLQIESSTLTDFDGILNAAYHYQTGAATPLGVMGDFRADNLVMEEEPFPAFGRYNADLAGGDLVEQFFRPFYSNLYNSILSANNVINNSEEPGEIAQARFLRALSYFKLVKVFGDVPVNLSDTPEVLDNSLLVRQPTAEIYDNIIIPDFEAAVAGLDNSGLESGRASQIAAQGFLGRIYMFRGDFGAAVTVLETVVNGAAAAGVMLEPDFANVVADGNSEVLFATILSTSIPDEYGFTEFNAWAAGGDTKSLTPLNPDLTAAFDAVAADTLATGDIRRALTIDETLSRGIKFFGDLEQDWIELRLSDVILLYAEALNETGAPAAEVLGLIDPIRTRAGLTTLNPTVLNTPALIRQAIQDERRLELAFEGQRWFDLVRTGTVDAEIGIMVDPVYSVFPIPNSEILASDGTITQNPGY